VTRPLAILLALATASLAFAQSNQSPGKALSGYRNVVVQLPEYANGLDVYGFGRYLVEQLRKDSTWGVIDDPAQVQQRDIASANETVVCVIDHEGEGGLTSPRVKLRFYDLAQTLVTTVDAKQGFFVGWTFDGAIKRAIDNALKDIAKDRRFDPRRVVDLAERFKNVERVEMDEAGLRRLLSDRSSQLQPIEGIWTTQDGVYRLGILRSGNPERLVAFILETKNFLWRPKMVKATFDSTAYPDVFSVNYFTSNHTNVGTTSKLTGGLLSIPITVDGKQDVVTLIKNYPANVSADAASPTSPERPNELLSSGTGFFVSQDLIVTCNHVIQGAKRSEIVLAAGKEAYSVEVLARDEANDLAVLRVLPKDRGAIPNVTPIAVVDSGDVRLGEQVYTLGFPLGSILGESPKVTEGTISALVGLQDDPRTLQISVPVQPGNSGGPLIDARGRVVGIVVASLSAKALFQLSGAIPQNVNFAVRSDYLLTLTRRLTANASGTPASLANLSRVDQIAKLVNSVGQVRAYAR
jgi:serine protease Do